MSKSNSDIILSMIKKNRKTLIDNILQADKTMLDNGVEVEIVIVGGASFILNKILPRATNDIDYINQIDESIAEILADYTINNRASMFASNFGEWEDDLVDFSIDELKGLKALTLKTLSIERLLASKFFSNKRHEDLIESFRNKNLIIDQKKFENIIEELMTYNDPIFKEEFTINDYLFDEIYQERGWHETTNIKNIRQKWVK